MKPLILYPLILLCSLQEPSCDYSGLFKECTKEVTAAGYLFLKSYNVQNASRFSYVFTKGNSYMILLAENPTARMPVKIYDNKKNIVADFTGLGEGKFKRIVFPCEASGIYYIEFNTSDQVCAACVLGFLPKKV